MYRTPELPLLAARARFRPPQRSLYLALSVVGAASLFVCHVARQTTRVEHHLVACGADACAIDGVAIPRRDIVTIALRSEGLSLVAARNASVLLTFQRPADRYLNAIELHASSMAHAQETAELLRWRVGSTELHALRTAHTFPLMLTVMFVIGLAVAGIIERALGYVVEVVPSGAVVRVTRPFAAPRQLALLGLTGIVIEWRRAEARLALQYENGSRDYITRDFWPADAAVHARFAAELGHLLKLGVQDERDRPGRPRPAC